MLSFKFYSTADFALFLWTMERAWTLKVEDGIVLNLSADR